MISGSDKDNGVKYQDGWFKGFIITLVTHHGASSEVDGNGGGRKRLGVQNILELVLPGCSDG